MPDKARIMQNFEEIENNGNQCTEYFNRVIGFVEDIVVSEEFQVRLTNLHFVFLYYDNICCVLGINLFIDIFQK